VMKKKKLIEEMMIAQVGGGNVFAIILKEI
jgi:hypothetical protein